MQFSYPSMPQSVIHARLSIVGFRAFPVAVASTWNSLPNISRLHPQCLFFEVCSKLSSSEAFLRMTFTVTFVVPVQ